MELFRRQFSRRSLEMPGVTLPSRPKFLNHNTASILPGHWNRFLGHLHSATIRLAGHVYVSKSPGCCNGQRSLVESIRRRRIPYEWIQSLTKDPSRNCRDSETWEWTPNFADFQCSAPSTTRSADIRLQVSACRFRNSLRKPIRCSGCCGCPATVTLFTWPNFRWRSPGNALTTRFCTQSTRFE